MLVALTDAAAADAEGVSELLELRVDERRGTLFFGRGDDGLVIVVSAGDRGVIDEVAERFEVRLGVSDPSSYDGFAGGRRSGARRARPRHGPVTDFSDVARSGVLSALSGEARALAAAELAPLTEHDAEHGTHLVETVRAWLDNDCSHEATARALGVHRHTVRTRLALVERELGRDLGLRDPRGAVGRAEPAARRS